MERTTSALEAARKELHRKKPSKITLDDLRTATDTTLEGGEDVDVLGFASVLLRQLSATLDLSLPGVKELITSRIAPALHPRAPLGALIMANLAHNLKSRAQRSSDLLTAATKLSPAFPDLLSPLFTALVSDSLARRPNLLGITILADAVPDSVVPHDLLPRLLADIDEVDASSQRCGAIVALLARHKGEDGAWVEPLIPCLGREESVVTLSRYLLPALTKPHRQAYGPLLSLLDRAAAEERYFGPWVAAASYGVSSGFIALEGLPQTRLEEGISHSDLAVRVMAFELLAHSRAVFTPRVMGLVKRALVINTMVPTAGGRTEMRSAIHGFLSNMKAQEDQARRDLKKASERAQSTLAAADEFHTWWLDEYLGPSIRACREMPPLRSIFALRLLRLYLDIYGSPVHGRVFTPHRVADLIACQASEFVDARVGARNLIALAPLPLAGFESLDAPAAKRLLRSARASINHPRLTQADAGRAALCILFTKLVLPSGHETALRFVGDTMGELERHIEKAEENLARGIVEYPLHGPLSALVELVRCLDLSTSDAQAAWRSTLHALNGLVLRVWRVTRKVVSLGPEEEGTSHEIARAYDVMGEDEEAGDHTSLLSGCWRAAREAAELLAAIITVPLRTKDQTIWSVAEVDAAGRNFLLWLHEIRHSGTFSRIAPALGTVVDAVRRIPSLSHLVGGWVDSQLAAVAEGRLSTLRRSAALPYTFLALLSDRGQRDRALDSLLSMAALSSPSSDATKVHAMNTLKVVLLDAKHAQALPAYLERTLTTSLQAFGSANWAVRNVALILFSTLTNRALSTSRPQDEGGRAALAARQTLASWDKKYPSLLPYLIQTLRDARGRGPLTLGEHSPLFPLLIIIRSLRWSPDGERLSTLLYPAVEPFLGSPEWMVRAAAAQALSSLLSPEAGLEKARVTATRISHASDEPNLLHGRLLFLRRLLEDVVARADGMAPRLRDALAEKAHPMISAAILDCVCAYVRISQATEENGKGREELLLAAVAAGHYFLASPSAVGSDLLHSAAARVLILAGKTVSLLHLGVPEDAQLLALAALEHSPATLEAVVRLAKRGSNAVRTAALEALADWPEGGAEIAELRAEMLRLAAHARSVPLKESALSALGRAFVSSPASNEEWSTLADLISSASDENQSEPRRESALSALSSVAPALLALPTSPRARLLRALLALLEDDDVDIRSGAAAAMSAARGCQPVDPRSAVDAWWAWLAAHVAEEKAEWEEWLWSLVLPPPDTGADARLFIEEPPNMFRDAVGLAGRAAEVLAGLGDSEGRRQALAIVDRIEDGAAYAPIDAGWAAAHVRRRRAAAVRTALGQ